MEHAQQTIIRRGGDDLERGYIYNAIIKTADTQIEVAKSDFAGADMADIWMRHLGRYGIALPFIRPGYRVLDFPCGSGVAIEVFDCLARFGSFTYEGWDCDAPTICYAREVYGNTRPWTQFDVRNLTDFTLVPEIYNTICCVEGIEHISQESQVKACTQFANGLKPGGTLVITCPPPEGDISGPNPKNSFHLWELTHRDFLKLLEADFGLENIELVTQKNLLSTGQLLTIFYAVCHKR